MPCFWWYRQVAPLAFLAAGIVALTGCQAPGYYAQAIKGQYQIVARQKSIDKLIADPNTAPRLKAQLELVQKLRAFAETDLKLPVNKHYRKYADLHRPFVVWNVQAAAQFSLEPKSWRYPLVGRLEYRGYFSEDAAARYAQELWEKGYDVYVDGVDAYSTLGWFADPVLNTFIERPEPELAEIIFHELSHQRVFARGDTDFNEAFATTVGQEGARRWLQTRGDTNLCAAYMLSLRRNDQFVHLVLATRARLEKLYGDTRDENGKIKANRKPAASREELQRGKERLFAELRRDYAQFKQQWGGFAGYDFWFASELNNAQLNTIANYYDFVPGFESMLRSVGGDLEQFYAAVERLAKLSKEERHRLLREWARRSAANGSGRTSG